MEATLNYSVPNQTFPISGSNDYIVVVSVDAASNISGLVVDCTDLLFSRFHTYIIQKREAIPLWNPLAGKKATDSLNIIGQRHKLIF